MTGGEVTLGSGVSPLGVIGLLAGMLAVVGFEYRRFHRRGLPFRVLLTGLRVVGLALIAIALLQPMRVHSVPDDRETSLLVLLDTSRSMRLPGVTEDESRADWLRDVLVGEQGLVERLSTRFRPRLYGFDGSASRIFDLDQLAADGSRTDVATALEQSTADLAGMSLSGALVSDGADNGGREAARPVQHLLDAGVRVHTLSVVDEDRQRDLRVEEVVAPNQVHAGDLVTVRVDVSAQGYAGVETPVRVQSATAVSGTESVFLTPETTRSVEIAFVAGAPGVHRYEVEVPPRDDEVVHDNNRRAFVVDVVPRQEVSVLFLEGRPRSEFAYLRRALAGDEEIVVDAVVALDDDSEYRLGGAPGADIEVMAYDAVILGDVAVGRHLAGGEEALARFVSQRGGGLLVLGSPALLEAGAALRDLLPVMLAEEARLQVNAVRLDLGPRSRHGIGSVLTAARLAELPDFRGHLSLRRIKPAATVLLQARGDSDVLMATQRYGAGRVAFFAITTSWHWRAFSDSGDGAYEDFWQRTVRSLVTRQSQMRLDMERFTYDLGEPVQIAAQVIDADHLPIGDARVSVAVGALGATESGRLVELTPTLGEPGRYEAAFTPETAGEYQLDAWAQRDGARVGEARGFFEVRDTDLELAGRIADVPLLQRLARQGGGLFFRPDQVGEIAEQLPLASPQTSRQIVDDLWHTPWLFLGILGLFCVEWLLRRRRGLVVLAVASLAQALPATAQPPLVLRDGDTFRLAYVEHETTGWSSSDWRYYGGSNLERFLRQMAKKTTIALSQSVGSVSLKDEDRDRLFAYPVLFMTSNNPAELSDEEIGNLREYLLRGGFLLADDCVSPGTFSGSRPPAFTRALLEVFQRVFPEREFEPIPHEHPIYHCAYDFPDGLPQMHPDGRWEGFGLFDDERLMVMLSPNDFCCGLQFSWGALSRDAYKFGVNVMIYALTH